MSNHADESIALAIVAREFDGKVKFLTVMRENPEGPRWVFPGGKIEAEESARAAARRELKEETGLEGSKPVCLGFRIHPATERQVYYVFLRDVYGTVSLEEGKIANFQWVEACELHEKLSAGIYPPVMNFLQDSRLFSCEQRMGNARRQNR